MGRTRRAPRTRKRGRALRRAARNGSRRLGDWEDDTVVGPGGACLVTIADRASRLLVGGRSAAHAAEAVGRVEVEALSGRPLETVTPDRGKEFVNHDEVCEALGEVQFYFCEPHHPWQKPTVENTNGLIREFFPKGTDFSKVTDEEVRRVYQLLNDRPRKVLGFRTPSEVYRDVLHSA